MAFRIHENIVQGEIDNRQRGRVRGSVWLVGRDEPVVLELTGNCLRDLAGCVLRFKNPRPLEARESVRLAALQRGQAGDVTASRKVRVVDVGLDKTLRSTKEGARSPEHVANALYIEWFSEANGRVVIESADYNIDVSAPLWVLSREDEQKQIEATREAMRDWLDRLSESLQPNEPASFDSDEAQPLDEFGYEKIMRESDVRTDKYIELLEKYEDHPDRERIVAREMGWHWLEEALEADERGALPPIERTEAPALEPNPATEGVDWIRDEDGGIHHPLTRRAFESAMSMWHYCKNLGLLGEDGDADLAEMIFQFQTTGAKIAGALDSLAYGEDLHEGAFIVAALKRALNYLHASMAAAERLMRKKVIASERLDLFRVELFEIREEILALMQRFRAKRL